MIAGMGDIRNCTVVGNLAKESHAPACRHPDGQMDVRRGCLMGAAPMDNESNRESINGEVPRDRGDPAMTDERIVDQVHQALHASGYGQLRKLQVHCDHGRVTLQGRLPTYYLKQVAQSLVDTVPGVHDIDNDVSVYSPK